MRRAGVPAVSQGRRVSRTRHPRWRQRRYVMRERDYDAYLREVYRLDLRELLDGAIEAIDVPDGDYASRDAVALAEIDAREQHHRRARTTNDRRWWRNFWHRVAADNATKFADQTTPGTRPPRHARSEWHLALDGTPGFVHLTIDIAIDDCH